jgi:hypothetical protein
MKLSRILKSFGTLSLVNFGRKHAERLAQHASPEIAARAAIVMAAVADLEAAYAVRHPLAALWSRAAAAKEEANDALDAAITALSYDLLAPALLDGDRRAPAYRALFPKGNIAFIDGPDRAELAQVAGMVMYLDANPSHPMASRADDLDAKADALLASLEPVTAAEAALRSAQAVEKGCRVELVLVLRKSAAVLRGALMDEDQVDALFPPIAEVKVAEDEAEAA